MPHFYRVLGNAKNKEYGILCVDKQLDMVMPHLPNIKLEVCYIIFAI
jgi:hypothetical protein